MVEKWDGPVVLFAYMGSFDFVRLRLSSLRMTALERVSSSGEGQRRIFRLEGLWIQAN